MLLTVIVESTIHDMPLFTAIAVAVDPDTLYKLAKGCEILSNNVFTSHGDNARLQTATSSSLPLKLELGINEFLPKTKVLPRLKLVKLGIVLWSTPFM